MSRKTSPVDKIKAEAYRLETHATQAPEVDYISAQGLCEFAAYVLREVADYIDHDYWELRSIARGLDGKDD